MNFTKTSDFLCAFGLSASLYAQARPWLDADSKRRLVFIEDRPDALAQLKREDDAIVLLNDQRVKLYLLETPLQLEPFAKKIAWSAVFLKMEILDVSHSPHFAPFRELMESTHLAADLLLSDGADWGCSAIRHAKKNLARPHRLSADLSFPNIPAVIVGAGPSLEKNGKLLERFQNRALILAGGNALDRLPFSPHFGAAVDKEEPLLRISFPMAPFCFQARMHPKNFALAKGEAILVPEGHFSFINWLAGEEPLFDGGWTVGNFLTALAVQWGCNPIVLVGMDYCYSGKKKYAKGPDAAISSLVETVNSEGRSVLTQRDWLMAVRWTEELAEKHRDRLFLNASEGGVRCLSPVKLQDLAWKEIPDLRATVSCAIERAPVRSSPDRWAEWEGSLRRCADLCNKYLEADFEGEIAYHLLLQPLWTIWKPVFEREIVRDMRLNEILFYQQVIQEHLDALL
jgi:hypothetical protein